MRFFLTLLLVVLAGPAASEAIGTKEAEGQLFSTRGHSVQVSRSLSEKDRKTVVGVIPLMASQLNQPVRYYASIAYSPDDGLVHEALQAAMNFHTVAAADAAAVAECNALKSAGARTCRVAARIVPKGFERRPLTLSVEATEGFSRSFRKLKGDRYFAISEATGAWGMGTTEAAAMGQCAVRDCKIVIFN